MSFLSCLVCSRVCTAPPLGVAVCDQRCSPCRSHGLYAARVHSEYQQWEVFEISYERSGFLDGRVCLVGTVHERAPGGLLFLFLVVLTEETNVPRQVISFLDQLGLAAVQEMVPRLQMDDLRWLVLHVYQVGVPIHSQFVWFDIRMIYSSFSVQRPYKEKLFIAFMSSRR